MLAVVIDQGILTPWFSPVAAYNKLLVCLFKDTYAKPRVFSKNSKLVDVGGI